MTFITTHPIFAIIALVLFVLLAALFVGGLFHSTGMHDEPVSFENTASFIEPKDLIDDEHPCSWCQKEQSIRAQPHESHGICKRHAEMLLTDARRINRTT